MAPQVGDGAPGAQGSDRKIIQAHPAVGDALAISLGTFASLTCGQAGPALGLRPTSATSYIALTHF